MARKTFKEEHAKKSPWLNAKKKPEKVIKSPYPLVTFAVTCEEKVHENHGVGPDGGPVILKNVEYTFVTSIHAQVINDYPQNKVWATVECPRCGAIKSGFYPVE